MSGQPGRENALLSSVSVPLGGLKAQHVLDNIAYVTSMLTSDRSTVIDEYLKGAEVQWM